MERWSSTVLVAILLGSFSLAQHPQEEEKLSQVQALIKGIGARYRAVFSLHMVYNTGLIFYNGKPRETSHHRADLTISGSSWHERMLSDDQAARYGRLTHRGKYLDYAIYKEEGSGKDKGWIRIHLPKSLDESYGNTYAPPYYAGTFWFKGECKYIEKYAAEAALLGEADIQGVRTQVVEWPIPDNRRLGELQNSVDISVVGGRMRLYVAPQFGYVILRQDHYNPRGGLVNRRWAKDFREYAPGIYIPQRIGCELYSDQKLHALIYYNIESLDHVNEPISEKAFILEDIPKGTVVWDGRSQTHSIEFHLGETPPVPGTEDLQEVLAELPPPARPGYSWGLAVLLGIALGLALLAWLALGYRYYRRQARQTPPPSPPA
jgi:hypothetical protein